MLRIYPEYQLTINRNVVNDDNKKCTDNNTSTLNRNRVSEPLPVILIITIITKDNPITEQDQYDNR